MEKNFRYTKDPHPHCTGVVLSPLAWALMISQSYLNNPNETGGALLGYRDGTTVHVTVALPSGPRSQASPVMLKYNEEFQNYVFGVITELMGEKGGLLGLWHRHPGSLDRFSGVDAVAHEQFGKVLNGVGVISLLINLDGPEGAPRVTGYFVDTNERVYHLIPVTVEETAGQLLIPAEEIIRKYTARPAQPKQQEGEKKHHEKDNDHHPDAAQQTGPGTGVPASSDPLSAAVGGGTRIAGIAAPALRLLQLQHGGAAGRRSPHRRGGGGSRD